jgi:hypothetical protein
MRHVCRCRCLASKGRVRGAKVDGRGFADSGSGFRRLPPATRRAQKQKATVDSSKGRFHELPPPLSLAVAYWPITIDCSEILPLQSMAD